MKNDFNISVDLAKEILELALSSGGDFAEVFMERTTNENYEMVSGKLSNASVSQVCGAALRIIKDDIEVNASITDCSPQNLKKAAIMLSKSFSGEAHQVVLPFVEKEVTKVVNPLKYSGTSNEQEIALLSKATAGAKEYSDEICQVVARITKKLQDIFVFASDSTWQSDTRAQTRLVVIAVASDGTSMQNGSVQFGRNQGMEMFDECDPYAMGQEAAHDAVEMLHAEEMCGGDIPVVIHNGFGGVILHEACVHGLEATSVAKGLSVFCNKLGQQIASPIVNAVDDGTNLNAWGSINVDDEGTPSRCNVLIENGILKSYLVDKKNSKTMNHPITGSSRRESYRHTTTSRMTNTYFLNGNSTFDEIIKSVKYGFFAKKMGGGSVQPATGEFNFAVNVGYLIEDGKITKPVRGATLVGSGPEVLMNIEMIADNLSCAHGMCGSVSGSIPTNVGQPTIKVSHMTVGGKGGSTK
ncbi:MAG: TldD/PmbA family protein [Bacilli bacterium]